MDEDDWNSEVSTQPGKLSAAWEKHFAWLPVVVNGEKVWLKTVYRRNRYVFDERWGWEYGTIFDVVKQ